MKKIRPIKRNWFDQLIKQNVMGKNPKIIRNKLKDKIMIFGHFLKQKKKKKVEKNNFWNNNHIEYKSNGHKNRNLLLDEYLNKTET